MKTIRVLYHLALADLYERSRRYSFLLILAAVIYLGVLVNNGTITVELGPPALTQPWIRYRGEFNSAWIGMMTVMVINVFLGLFGFYLVNDCIQRDIHTGVGQIIATTPLRRATYLVGKWISNCLVLSVLVLILAAAAAIMVMLKREAALELGVLLMPFLAVALPYMALIAALAVVFETIPWLRGAVGNAVYFFLWVALIMLSLFLGTMPSPVRDPIGNSIFTESLHAAASAAFPNESIGKLLGVGGYNIQGDQVKVFHWPGLDWTPAMVGEQWCWAALGLGLVLLSALWFARFDPSREGLRQVRAKPEPGKEAESQKETPRLVLPSLSPLVSWFAQANPFLGALFAELRLLLNGRRWWWWAVLIGLNIAILGHPNPLLEPFLLPAIWLWPLAIWSEMGNRERKNNTHQMIFSSARPVLRQLPAAWLAGILATVLLSMGGAVFMSSNGDLAGWVGAVIFIPALALALGVFSSGSRVFEVIYVIWWYTGPLQKIPGLDFTSGAPQVYLLAAIGLLLLSMYWRGRQVREL